VDGVVIDIKFQDLFRQHIDRLLADKGVAHLDWLILSVDQLEILQPHIAAGTSTSRVLDKVNSQPFDEVLIDLHDQTGRTFKDSFLYRINQALYQQMGVED
jgi:hypothetical protein